MIQELIGQEVVVDLRSPFVCLGTLVRCDDQFLELENADFHDLRDSSANRENYLAAARASGIIPNRRRVLLVRAEVIALCRLQDINGG